MDRTQSKYALTTQKLIIKRKIVGIAFFFLKMGKSISPAQMAVIRLASHNGQAHSTKQGTHISFFDNKPCFIGDSLNAATCSICNNGGAT